MSIWNLPTLKNVVQINTNAPANTLTVHLMGPVGCGKTVVAASVAHNAPDVRDGTFISSENFAITQQRSRLFNKGMAPASTHASSEELVAFRVKSDAESDNELSVVLVARRGEDILTTIGGRRDQTSVTVRDGRRKVHIPDGTVRFNDSELEELFTGPKAENSEHFNAENTFIGFVLNPLRDINDGEWGRRRLHQILDDRINIFVSEFKKQKRTEPTTAEQLDRVWLELDAWLDDLINIDFETEVRRRIGWNEVTRELENAINGRDVKQRFRSLVDFIIQGAIDKFSNYRDNVISRLEAYPHRSFCVLTHFDVLSADQQPNVPQVTYSELRVDKARIIYGPFAFHEIRFDTEDENEPKHLAWWPSHDNVAKATVIQASARRFIDGLKSIAFAEGHSLLVSNECAHISRGPIRFFGSLGDLAMSYIIASPLVIASWLLILVAIKFLFHADDSTLVSTYAAHGLVTFLLISLVWITLVLPYVRMSPYSRSSSGKLFSRKNCRRWWLRRKAATEVSNGRFKHATDKVHVPQDHELRDGTAYRRGFVSKALNCAWAIEIKGRKRTGVFLIPEFKKFMDFFGPDSEPQSKLCPVVCFKEGCFLAISISAFALAIASKFF